MKRFLDWNVIPLTDAMGGASMEIVVNTLTGIFGITSTVHCIQENGGIKLQHYSLYLHTLRHSEKPDLLVCLSIIIRGPVNRSQVPK